MNADLQADNMNIAKLAERLAVDENLVRGMLERNGCQVINGSPIPNEWIAVVAQEYAKPRKKRTAKTNRAAADILKNLPAVARGAAVIAPARAKGEEKKWGWAEWFAVLPLPMLGLVASYGVWSFSGFFVPTWMQWVEAVSFEAIYISLAAVGRLSSEQQKLAGRVSLGALIVSALYGSLAASFHIDQNIFSSIPIAGKISLAVLHGVPVPALAYYMANLLLHRK